VNVSILAIHHCYMHDLVIPAELQRNLRRADAFIQLAVVSAFEVFRQLECSEKASGDNCGLVISTSFGTMETNFDVLAQIVGGEQTSPTLFSHSVFNAAAGYMASVFSIRGYALTITDFSVPFFRALQEGWLALRSGRISSCLVVQVETYSALLHDARKWHNVDKYPWPAGAGCWLLQIDDKNEKNCYRLDIPEIIDGGGEPLDCLRCDEEITINSRPMPIHDPLAGMMILGNEINGGDCGDLLSCRIKGAWGEARLQLKKG